MATIKVIDAVNAYNALKSLKLSTIDDDLMLNVWKNIKELRKVDEEYKKDIEDSKAVLMDEKFAEMQERLYKAKAREDTVKKGEYEMTSDDIADVAELNEYFAAYNQKANKLSKEIDSKKVSVNIVKISEEDFLKVLKSNDKDFTIMEILNWMVC